MRRQIRCVGLTKTANSSSVRSSFKSATCSLGLYGGAKGSNLSAFLASAAVASTSNRGDGRGGFFWRAGQSVISNWLTCCQLQCREHVEGTDVDVKFIVLFDGWREPKEIAGCLCAFVGIGNLSDYIGVCCHFPVASDKIFDEVGGSRDNRGSRG